MEKISKISTLSICFLCSSLSTLLAQDPFYISSTGNIGINSADPVNRLQLGGNIHMDGNAIYFRRGTLDKNDLVVWNPVTDKMDMAGWNGVTLGYTVGSSAIKPALTVENTGKVGIGVPVARNLLSVGGAADFTGRVEVGSFDQRTPKSALNVYGNIGLTGTHLIYDSKQAVIDWGNSEGGTLHFRTLSTQGSDTARYYDQMYLKNNVSGGVRTTELEVLGNIKADAIETKNNPKGNIARRDLRPYGEPSYCWDGYPDERVPMEVFSTRGGATIDRGYIENNRWNGKRMVGFRNLSQESQTNNSIPADGFYIKIPPTAGCINSLLLATIDHDRWSTCSVWLVKSGNRDPVKLARSANNANESGDKAFTYTLGPHNEYKGFFAFAWMTFPITRQQVADYTEGGKLTFLVTTGPQNGTGERTLFVSGVALVPNPYGFNQQPALSLHWGLNGDKADEISWHGKYINQSLAKIPGTETRTVFIKIVDPDRDALITFYELGDNDFRSSIYVTVDDNNKRFYPSPAIIGIGPMIYKSFNNLKPTSIIIPSALIKEKLKRSNSGVSSVIKLNLRNPGNYTFYLFGIDSEIY